MARKSKKRPGATAAAAAAAAAAHDNAASSRSATSGPACFQALSTRTQYVSPFLASPFLGRRPAYQHSALLSNPFIPQSLAMGHGRAANRVISSPALSGPWMTMRRVENVNMPLLQSGRPFVHPFPVTFGSMCTPGGHQTFRTAPPNMFPGQDPSPSLGHYEGCHHVMASSNATTLNAAISIRTSPHPAVENTAERACSAFPPPYSPRQSSHGLAIKPPSEASGGVPDPTPSYLARASFLPKRRQSPGPLLVVIDLNGTLLHRPGRSRPSKFQKRPHADRFVRYCIDTFWVVIWSSARPENVRRMVRDLLGPVHLQRVVAVWGRDKFGLTPDDYNERTQCYKRLTILWADPVVGASFPADRGGFEGKCWDQGNTILIDDSAEKARSEPYNTITIPEFRGDSGESPDTLPIVHEYLNELAFQHDVSMFVRANPFRIGIA